MTATINDKTLNKLMGNLSFIKKINAIIGQKTSVNRQGNQSNSQIAPTIL